MIVKANFTEALRSLVSSKQRSLLALIGIVIGIGSVIGMVSIGNVVQVQALKQFRDMGVDVITIRKSFGGGGGPGPAVPEGDFRLSDIAELPAHVPAILQVAPYATGGGQFSAKGKKEYLTLLGVTESFFGLNKLKVVRGRQLTDLDVYSPFCVIGEETAQILRQGGVPDAIGGQVKLDGAIFTIVGVLANVPEGGGMRPPGLNRGIIIHVTTASRVSPGSKINAVLGRTQEKTDAGRLKQQVQAYFSSRVKNLNTEVATAEELIASMEKQMKLFTLLLGAIGSIALIVGGVGVMNVMLVSVSERRKEIGIRRALGAQREDIQTQFIIESIVLCLTGGFIGIILGILISYAFAYFTKWDFMISYGAVLIGIAVSTTVGVFFGFYPARQAAHLDPITALRGE